MPIFNKSVLYEQARDLGFIPSQFEKMSRLINILRFLNDSDETSTSLALRGGTAINLTVFNLPRLSVDIDLDFTENLSKEETRFKRDRINILLDRYMSSEGYGKHVKTKYTHALDSHVYSYINAAGNNDNIKVEVVYTLRNHVFPTVTSAIIPTQIFDSLIIRTLSPIEIFAGKIVALCDRAAVRDLFDVNNLIKEKVLKNEEFIELRKCAVFYLAISGNVEDKGFKFERIRDISKRKLRSDLQPLLRKTDVFELESSLNNIYKFLADHINITANEFEFLQEFFRGNYNPTLLFDDETASRIITHPMALWRQQNIQKEMDAIRSQL